MRFGFLLLVIVCLFPAGTGLAKDAQWQVMAGSRIGFTAYQPGTPIEGSFASFRAELHFDENNLQAARVIVDIDTESVNTQRSDRDATLRGADFFAVKTWPTARFATREFVAEGEGLFRAEGDLQIRDITRPISLPFRLKTFDHPEEAGAIMAVVEAEVTLSRLAFGIGQGEWLSTAYLRDEVDLEIVLFASQMTGE